MTIKLEGLELQAVRVSLQDLKFDLLRPEVGEPDEQDKALAAAAASVLAKILK